MLFRSLAFQCAGVLLAVLIASWLTSFSAGLAVLFGACGALLNTGLLLWRYKRGEHDYHCDAGRHLKSFYRSSIERFAVVVAWLAIGFALLDLSALPVILGFVIGQLAWVLAALLFR